MKYLCLIYDNEQAWAEMPKEVQDKYMGEYTAFGESIRKSGKYVGAHQLQPRVGGRWRGAVGRDDGRAGRPARAVMRCNQVVLKG